EVDGLRTARGLARAGETASPEERIDGARLADVRAAREGDLGQLGRRQVARMTDGAQELRLGEKAHGCRNWEILIKSALSQWGRTNDSRSRARRLGRHRQH